MSAPSFDEAGWDAGIAALAAADVALAEGRIEDADALAGEAERMLVLVVGPTHPDYANALVTQGMIVAARGRAIESMLAYRAALLIYDEYLDDPGDADAVRPLRIDVLGLLGQALSRVAQYEEAEALLNEAIDEAGRAYGPSSEEVALQIANLGVCLRFQGRYRDARAMYERAAALRSELGLPLDATHLLNLSGLASAEEDFVQAEQHARQAMAVRRASGADPFALGTDHAGLGDALAGQGRCDEAELAYRDALTLYRAAGRGAHPEVGYAEHNLGDLLASCGRAREAEAAYRASIDCKTAAFGDDHPEVAATINNLAALLHETGRAGEARDAARRAVQIARAKLGADHPIRRGIESLSRSIGA